jgi:SAM-dependent methyltransferase
MERASVEHIDKVARLKRKVSRHPFLRFIASCPYRAPKWDRKVSALIEELGSSALILDLGSGSQRRARHIINLEIEPMPNVDVVGDGHQLPFRDEVFDAVILEAVLEHVREPEIVVSEVHRVLRLGGQVHAGVPFIQGYHASPEDYQRYTVRGLENLFLNFQKIESGTCVGATSALHWIFREYIGILFSFGNVWLYKSLSLIVGWLTFPIVYLDAILAHNKNAHAIASAVFFIGKK